MSEDLHFSTGTKEEKYRVLIPQLAALLHGEQDGIANFANMAAALKETFSWLWVGFYFVRNEHLVLGPFQGPVACTRIRKGQGVCGTAWLKGESIIVGDVEEFPGHIACSSLSRSEIVIPFFKGGTVAGVLDVDSTELNDFDRNDLECLEEIVGLIAPSWEILP
ncbi:MAG: GAF domain-containing protein [Chitinophagaceae bacterium]